jgi:hypothetical protein
MYQAAERIAGVIAILIVVGIAVWQFAVYVLPWLVLIALVGAAVVLFFRYWSSRPSIPKW